MIIRSLLRKCPLRLQKSYVTLTRRRLVINSVDPLRILFCGADEFSIASLEALDHEKKVNPELIESLDVVCKVGKKHGRGLKNVREGMQIHTIPIPRADFPTVPIVDAAQELSLPLHKIENFTGWEVRMDFFGAWLGSPNFIYSVHDHKVKESTWSSQSRSAS